MGNFCCCLSSSPHQAVQSQPPVASKVSDPYHTAELELRDFNDLSKFSFTGILTKARVVDVYDGDTVTVVFYYGDRPIKDSMRLAGYDAPELHPRRDCENREQIVVAAQIAREFLLKLVNNQIVWVKFTKEDKYGRLLGHIYLVDPESRDIFMGQETCVNRLMVERGYGKSYDGGTKCDFSIEELQYINKLSVS